MFRYLALFLFASCLLQGQDLAKLMEGGPAEGIIVDLREPLYENGILSTEKGGVISGPNLRIQAVNLRYIRQRSNETSITIVEAEHSLIVEFGEYLFVGEKLVYDFQKKEGTLYMARTSVEPWYFGGEWIDLRADGSYLIHNAFITTSEKTCAEWGLHATQALIDSNNHLIAENLQLRVLNLPLLWIPSIRADLDSILDNPLRYRFRWGGKQGPRLGLTYELFSLERWKTFLRFDYRLTRGPGGGFEVNYLSEDHKTRFNSINYASTEASLSRPHEHIRYRFEGSYKKIMLEDKLKILLTYDKLSDIDMPGDYRDKDFDLETSERTQLLVRHQEENWIGSFYTRVRVNYFQTVKQELPTISTHFRPFLIGSTGIIAENWGSASYLDFKYANHLQNVRDYSSTRFQYFPKFYRPFLLNSLYVTPQLGGGLILYGNSPEEEAQYLLFSSGGLNVNTRLCRFYGHFKHVVEPYTTYRFYTPPTSSPNHHFIFDLSDGWDYLQMVTVGFKNSIYAKKQTGCVSRIFVSNIYAHAFIDSTYFKQTIPKIYGEFIFATLPTLRHTIDSAWDFEHNIVDHFNFRSEWTFNTDFACATEYRYRSPYDWRKVDYENFFLEAFHTECFLRHSTLSDQRNTILLHLFYRFHPNWACEVSSRHGWNRRKDPNYTEYEINLLTTVRTAWHLQFSFQHRERDNRFATYVNIGLKKPECTMANKTNYCYE